MLIERLKISYGLRFDLVPIFSDRENLDPSLSCGLIINTNFAKINI